MTEIQKLERNTSNFFKNDSFRTLKFLNNAIEKYEDFKYKNWHEILKSKDIFKKCLNKTLLIILSMPLSVGII